MKFRRSALVFIFALILNTIFSSFAFADSNTKLNLVALGDSITFGWNLDKVNDPNNLQPHPGAFPYLIGSGDYIVTKNISGGGWTSQNLLDQLQDPANIVAIQNANLITVDIGNNDLLKTPAIAQILGNPSEVPTQDQVNAATQAALQSAAQLGKNLGTIIGTIKSVNPNATVILYNLYDPFGDNAPALHSLAEQIIPQINDKVINPIASQTGSHVADAYTAFSGHQADYILPGDIHPTLAGHQVLAGLANTILDELTPLTVDLSPSTTENTAGPVTINVTTNAKEVLQMKWLPGEKTAADFKTGGNLVTDHQFEVTDNGTYTVYVMDSREKEAVKVIDITNIVKTVSSNPGNGSQPAAPGGTDNQKPATPTTTPTSSPSSNTGHALPETASPMYGELAIGMALVLAGLAVLILQQKRRREN